MGTRIASVLALAEDRVCASNTRAVESVSVLAVETEVEVKLLAEVRAALALAVASDDAAVEAALTLVVTSVCEATAAADMRVLMVCSSADTEAVMDDWLVLCDVEMLAVTSCDNVSMAMSTLASIKPLGLVMLSRSASKPKTEYVEAPIWNSTSLRSDTARVIEPSAVRTPGIIQPLPSGPGVPLAPGMHSQRKRAATLGSWTQVAVSLHGEPRQGSGRVQTRGDPLQAPVGRQVRVASPAEGTAGTLHANWQILPTWCAIEQIGGGQKKQGSNRNSPECLG